MGTGRIWIWRRREKGQARNRDRSNGGTRNRRGNGERSNASNISSGHTHSQPHEVERSMGAFGKTVLVSRISFETKDLATWLKDTQSHRIFTLSLLYWHYKAQ